MTNIFISSRINVCNLLQLACLFLLVCLAVGAHAQDTLDTRAAESRRTEEILGKEFQKRFGNSKRDTYAAAIAAKIRSNLVPPPGLSGNPRAVFEIEQIKIASGGQIVSVKLKQPSGNHALDVAIERAIHASNPLPLPDDPALFSQKIGIVFLPLEN